MVLKMKFLSIMGREMFIRSLTQQTFYFFLFFYLTVLGLLAVRGLSLVAASKGLLSHYGTWAWQCGCFVAEHRL